MAVRINVRRPFHHDRAQIRCIRFALILSLVAERVSPPLPLFSLRGDIFLISMLLTPAGGLAEDRGGGEGGALSGLIHISRRVLMPCTLFYFHVEFLARLLCMFAVFFIRTLKHASYVITEERSNNNTCVSFASAPASRGWCAKSF